MPLSAVIKCYETIFSSVIRRLYVCTQCNCTLMLLISHPVNNEVCSQHKRRFILKNILERKVNEEPEDQVKVCTITISLIEIFPKTGLFLPVKHLAGVWHLELCLNKSDKTGKVKCIIPDKHAPKTDHLRLCNSYFSKIGSFVLKVTTVRSTASESITERSLPLRTRQNLLPSLFFDSEVLK